MKKSLWQRLVSLGIALTMFAGLAACGQPGTKPGEAADDANAAADTSNAGSTIKIGVALPTLQEERWQNDKAFFEEEAKKLDGVELLMQIADNDSDKQFSQIENLISQGIDALIVGAVDTAAIGQVVDRCQDEGIKVVAYCRLIQNANLDLLTLFDQYQVQEQSVKYALEHAPKGNYVLLNADETTLPEAEKYKEAWYDYLQPYIDKGDITVVMDQYTQNWAANIAMANMENALAKTGNDIAAVLCANDGIAGGAIQALEAQGLAGKVVVTGHDADVTALKRIVAGTQSSTIFYNTRTQVIESLKAAVALVSGQSVKTTGTYNNGKMDVPALELDSQLVDKDNLEEVIIDGGIRTHEEIYG